MQLTSKEDTIADINRSQEVKLTLDSNSPQGEFLALDKKM